jgi:hypothetical protein
MKMSVSIYVVSLEQDRYFIHRSYGYGKLEIELFNEFEYNYEFVKLFKPLYIIEILPEENGYHLDYMVKKYMLKYGMENVRGGSYSDVILSKKQTEILGFEYSTSYASFIELNEKTKEEFDWLRTFCRETVSNFNYTYTTETEDQQYYKIVLDWRKMNLDVLNRYSELLKICKYIYKKYKQFFLEESENVYCKYPEFLLDEFFLHKYSMDTSDLCHVYAFCDMMLFMLEKLE